LFPSCFAPPSPGLENVIYRELFCSITLGVNWGFTPVSWKLCRRDSTDVYQC